METITVKEIVKACKGDLLQGKDSIKVKGIFIDSRLVEEEGAFFALKGERVDGHDYVKEAAEKGCSLAVVERKLEKRVMEELAKNVTLVLVENMETALGDLARYYLEKFQIKKVAVTGSTGKTTTKEMLSHILSQKYKTICSEGNYNNLIGLPLTAFRLDSTFEAVVFEMGMDRPGEIHRMAEIVKPQMALVTNVGLSHLSRLKTKENILKAKGEVRDFLIAGDVLLINGEDEMMKAWESEDASFDTISVKTAERADRQAEGERLGRRDDGIIGERGQAFIFEVINLGEAGTEFGYCYEGVSERIKLTVPGLHNVMNAAMAITGALKLGLDIEVIKKALEDFKAEDMRLNIINCGDFKIIDDTYNASPDSVKAAIDVLSSVDGKRRIAILGDMFELGSESAVYHKNIGNYAFQKGLDVILSVGENAKDIVNAAKENSMKAVHFDSKEMLIAVLSQWIRKGDIVLVKGSRGMAMEDIVGAVKEMKIN